MSDPLAEAITEAAEGHRWRFDPTPSTWGRSCQCGRDFDSDHDYQRHVYEEVAAAARAFIGDEIKARHAEEDAQTLPYPTYQEGYRDGLGDAEQIARGDTK